MLWYGFLFLQKKLFFCFVGGLGIPFVQKLGRLKNANGR